MVGAGGGDDGVPYYGLVLGDIAGDGGGRGGRPLGGDVDEDLLGVPVEEGGEIGFEGELDYGVFFFFGTVVVWSAADAVGGISIGFWEEGGVLDLHLD